MMQRQSSDLLFVICTYFSLWMTEFIIMRARDHDNAPFTLFATVLLSLCIIPVVL